MAQVEIARDESGDFSFSGKTGSSRYFMITTITTGDNAVAHRLLDLRNELMWNGYALPSGFHARNDSMALRRRAYQVIAASGVRIDATIVEKSKVDEALRLSNERLWQFVWFVHLRHVIPRVAHPTDELLVLAAAIRTQMRVESAARGIVDVVGQLHSGPKQAHVVNAASDLLVQAADYCGWAIQRKWERGDASAHGWIRHLIASEHAVFEK